MLAGASSATLLLQFTELSLHSTPEITPGSARFSNSLLTLSLLPSPLDYEADTTPILMHSLHPQHSDTPKISLIDVDQLVEPCPKRRLLKDTSNTTKTVRI